MSNYVKIERSDAQGSYIEKLERLLASIEAETDGWDNAKPGVKITLTLVQVSDEEYEKSPEFTGW